MCITHSVFFFSVPEYALYALLALCVQGLTAFGLTELFHQVQILRPYMAMHHLLPFFIRSAFLAPQTAAAFRRCASVYSLPVSVSCGMPQSLSVRTDQGVRYYIIFVLPRPEMSFCGFGLSIRQDGDPAVVKYFLCYPRSLIASVHYDELCFVKPAGYFVIYRVPCHTVAHIACCYLYRQYHSVLVAGCMCFICKLPFMLAFYEHSAIRVCR